MGGYTFTPEYRSVTVAGADVTAQDFSATCVLNTYYEDFDFDTYGDASSVIQSCVQPAGYVTNGDDCNDGEPDINPGAVEICNLVDDNCNGQVDEGGTNPFWPDGDDDGYGDVASVPILACFVSDGYAPNNVDCDDSKPEIHPGAVDISGDGIDQDCSGSDAAGLRI
ncbi:MAG: putative metal-binding motif-containing protein [Nitrospirae bacterium]|nr:putative metal-binding motif-containing protein [Nitrospirota bacterium]